VLQRSRPANQGFPLAILPKIKIGAKVIAKLFLIYYTIQPPLSMSLVSDLLPHMPSRDQHSPSYSLSVRASTSSPFSSCQLFASIPQPVKRKLNITARLIPVFNTVYSFSIYFSKIFLDSLLIIILFSRENKETRINTIDCLVLFYYFDLFTKRYKIY